jgi:NhaP-type Na+/H+ or K+/H+ antiporter
MPLLYGAMKSRLGRPGTQRRFYGPPKVAHPSAVVVRRWFLDGALVGSGCVEEVHPTLTFALALAAGVLCQSVARHLRVPGIVLLLGAGVGLGAEGLGWVHPEALGEGLFSIVHLAVAVILFEGGLNLEISRLRRAQAVIRRLVTLGALLTLLGGTLAAHWILGWDPMLALLFGSLVVVTGPTVIGPLVHELRLRPKVATVLEAEGVLIDPIGALLAVLALEIVLAPDPGSIASGAAGLVYRIGFGALAGALAGFALGLLLRTRWVPEGFQNITSLASVLLLFEACESVLAQSGILAVTIAGVVVGNVRTRVDRDLREFKDQLSVMLIGLLFVLLAADVRFDDLRDLGVRGLAVVGVLIVMVRPLGVSACTLGSTLSWQERLLVSWVAPRGIVAAAIASITAVALDASGEPGGAALRALVFLTITGTVLIAGFTALPVAHLLGLRLPGRETVAILGAEGVGLSLALELRHRGVPVIMLDSNPQHCRRAEEAGLPVVFGNALEERIMQRARFESVGAAIGVTANEALNSTFITRARAGFSVPRGYVALRTEDSGVTRDILEEREIHLLFDGVHDVERWNVRERHGEMLVERLRFVPPKPADPEAGEAPEPARRPSGKAERYMPLVLTRGRRSEPIQVKYEPQANDLVAMAIHLPEREDVLEYLANLGWELEDSDPSLDQEAPGPAA